MNVMALAELALERAEGRRKVASGGTVVRWTCRVSKEV